jgi:hypothetical protein
MSSKAFRVGRKWKKDGVDEDKAEKVKKKEGKEREAY